VRVVGRQTIENFCVRYPEARGRMNAWLVEAEHAIWKRPADLKARYASASFLAGSTVVFNIGGNRFRLVAKVAFQSGTVMVVRVGTHAEYDAWKL